MTVAERVKKAIAEYYRIDVSEVTDDRKLNDHMLLVFITIKLDIPSSGTVGEEQTVGQLIAQFEKMAKLHDSGTYAETPVINSVRDAVAVATAKHNGIKVEEITDNTTVLFADYQASNAFSNHMCYLLGYTLGLNCREKNLSVKKITEMFESLREAARHGI